MNTRSSFQPHFSNSEAIRNEIQRFEGVHPSIYAIYDLIELAGDTVVAQRIRDHVVCIEGKNHIVTCSLHISYTRLAYNP